MGKNRFGAAQSGLPRNGFSLPKRSILLIVVLGVLAFSFYKLVLLDQMGFCYQRLWFVSSEELILNHIGRLMKSGRMKLDAEDTSPQAYLAHHPNCCRVDRGGNPFLLSSAEVTVVYEMDDAEKSRRGASTENYYEFVSFDTACGERLRDIGTTTMAPAKFHPATNK